MTVMADQGMRAALLSRVHQHIRERPDVAALFIDTLCAMLAQNYRLMDAYDAFGTLVQPSPELFLMAAAHRLGVICDTEWQQWLDEYREGD